MRNISTVLRNLSNEAAADKHPVRAAGDVHGADAGHRMIHVRHLLLDLEITRIAESLDDEVDAEVLRGIDRQTGALLHPYPVERADAVLHHGQAFVDREQAA